MKKQINKDNVSISLTDDKKKKTVPKKKKPVKKQLNKDDVSKSLTDNQKKKAAPKKKKPVKKQINKNDVSKSLTNESKKKVATQKKKSEKKQISKDAVASLTVEQKKEVAIKEANKRIILDTIIMITILVIATIIFNIFFGLKVVDGNGMYPALMDGDLTLTYSKSGYVKNDVVFYRVDRKEYCGRVVAKAGDSIKFSDDGKFYVNGMVQSDKIMFPTNISEGVEKNMIVPDNSVYILGDYRTSSVDSRDLGFISLDDIDSKIIALLRHKKI